MSKKYYPDISHYEPVRNWNEVKEKCPFLISKATEGTNYVDSTLKSFIKNCEDRKIPYWLYAYLDKGSELAQVKFLVRTCKKLVGKYFVGYVLDVEAGNEAGNVRDALKYLEGLKYKVMLYHMYADYASYKTVVAGRGKNTAWWEARYGRNDGVYSAKYPCHRGVELHQFTDAGTCPGIGKSLDLNRITGQGKNEEWFMTPSDMKSNTAIAKEVIAGKWSNGIERKRRLEAAGYNYAAIQKIVNKLLE